MQPSVKQLREWTKVEGDNGEWVRVPSSAWIEVLWLLSVFEKIEGNKAVDDAFAEAAGS